MKKATILMGLLFLLGTNAWGRTTQHDPTSFIIQKFDQYPIVALGEIHGKKDLHELYEQVINHKDFRSKVKNVVLEYANARYQQLIDDYIGGKDISLDEVRKVWRDLLVSPFAMHATEEFEHFFVAVRQSNMGKPANQKIRILAGGLPIDWSEIKSINDYMAYRSENSRDDHYGQVILDHVLNKGEKALLISGTVHLKKQARLVEMVESKYPGAIYHIFPMTDFSGRTKEISDRLGGLTKPGIIDLKDHFLANIDKPSVSTSQNANIRLVSLSDDEPEQIGDLYIDRDTDGVKSVFQLTKEGKTLVAKQGVNYEQENPHMMFLRFTEGTRHRILAEDQGKTLGDIADALLLINATKMKLPESLWADDAFWEALDARLIMLTGQKSDPRVRSTKGKYSDSH